MGAFVKRMRERLGLNKPNHDRKHTQLITLRKDIAKEIARKKKEEKKI